MRARVFVSVASIAVGMGIAAACSTFSSEGGDADAGSDGAADAAPVDASADGSGKLPPTPGIVECFGATCSAASSQSCCYAPEAGTTRCAKSCAMGVVPLDCDDRTDCAPGRICCVGVFGNADCQEKCNGERLCHTDDECDVGSSCVVLPCRGSVLGACGPVGPYVRAFCDPHDR